ncbi:MAG: hypothetical protein V2I33_20130, partial [Kangiellaceae bacterium]|jgi:hypothetical protein|nr:hypothetical protein [Kangiellaceae bacterium]
MGARADSHERSTGKGREGGWVEGRGFGVGTDVGRTLQPSGATMTDKARFGGSVGAVRRVGGAGHGAVARAMVIALEER